MPAFPHPGLQPAQRPDGRRCKGSEAKQAGGLRPPSEGQEGFTFPRPA